MNSSMIKIIFNPFYGNHVYVDFDKRNSVIGEKHVNGSELINELQLRAGLTSVISDDMERTARYMKAINSALNDAANPHVKIFRSSFDNDRLGVATTLLGWRDTLIKMAWSPEKYTKSPKLNALIDIEKYFDCPGLADCRKELLEKMESKQVSLEDLSIESILPNDKLPYYFSRLLNAAADCGATVTYSDRPLPAASEGTVLRLLQEYLLEGKKVNLSDMNNDDSIKLYRLHNADDALRYAALSHPDVISAKDSVLIREVFRAKNLPLTRTTDTSVPQVVRLLPLALSLRKRYVDVNSLLAFLSIEPNPLSSLKVKVTSSDKESFVSVNRLLREHLLSKGGFGEEWYDVLNGEMYDWEGQPVKKTNKILELIAKMESYDGTMTKEELDTILKQLMSWSTKDMDSRGALLRYCRFVKCLIEDDETIEVDSLIRWLSSVAAPAANSIQPAEVGSCDMIETPSSLTDQVDCMCWADCWHNGKTTNELDFLSPIDIEEMGVAIDSAQKLYESQRMAIAYGLSKVKSRLVILTCNKVDGELAQEHPLMIELKTLCGLKEDSCSDEDFTSLFDINGKPERKIEHKVNEEHFKNLRKSIEDGGLRRKCESYSSLDKLINFPFDYVMDYLLHWNAYGVDAMPDIAMVKGKVAHRYIELLLKDSKFDLAKAKDIHNNNFDERVKSCIEENGLVLNLDENRLACSSYLTALKSAVTSLLKFIEDNKLTVVSMEEKIDTKFDVIGDFTGSIDLLLSNEEGDLVVVDMKWSEGKTYKERLEKGDILQLALYRKALELKGHNVVGVGYFVLPQRKFFTSSDSFTQSDIVELVEGINLGDYFKLACNSYKYRMKQIEQGVIEDAEGAALADIQYHNDMHAENLYPLKTDYNDQTMKGSPYGKSNLILKGGIE